MAMVAKMVKTYTQRRNNQSNGVQIKMISIVKQVISNNPLAVYDYHLGEYKGINFLVGQCMRATKGKDNPKDFENLIVSELTPVQKLIPEEGALFEDILIPLSNVATKAVLHSEGESSIWKDYDGFNLDVLEDLVPIKERGDSLSSVLEVAVQLGICQGKRMAHYNGILVYDTQLEQWLGKVDSKLCYVKEKAGAHIFNNLKDVKEAVRIEQNPEHSGRYELLSIVVGAHWHQMDE